MFRLFKKVRLFLTVDDSVGIFVIFFELSLGKLNLWVIPVIIFCLFEEVGLSLNTFLIAQSWNVYTRSILHGFKSLLEALNLRIKLGKIISMLQKFFFSWFPLLSKFIKISCNFLDFLESELLKVYSICLIDSLDELYVFIQLGLLNFLLIFTFFFNLVILTFIFIILLLFLFLYLNFMMSLWLLLHHLWRFGCFLLLLCHLFLTVLSTLSQLGRLWGNVNRFLRNLHSWLNLGDTFSNNLNFFRRCL